MPPFRQAPHDPAKAARDGVTNYIPKRTEPDRSFTCEDCDRTATWAIIADGDDIHACDTHRKEYAITAIDYREKRLR